MFMNRVHRSRICSRICSMNLIGMDQVEAIGYIKKLQMSQLKHKSLLDQNFLKSRDMKAHVV